ncbi:MAG: biopolymer transporter ExbD [Pirellulales bacterium]
MRLKSIASPKPNHRESAMTPMIDVVFQLLAFFILTFRVVVPEGDFGVSMPAVSSDENAELRPEETLHVHLVADAEGRLADVRVNHRSLGPDVQALHRIVMLVADVDGPSNLRADIDARLRFDPQLHYEHAMAALAAISAYRDANGNSAVLIEHVRFERPDHGA